MLTCCIHIYVLLFMQCAILVLLLCYVYIQQCLNLSIYLSIQAAQWSAAFSHGVTAVRTYGGADVGMRTLLDALVPAVEALSTQGLDSGRLAEVRTYMIYHEAVTFLSFFLCVILRCLNIYMCQSL
jgi:hypothetical protein